MDLGKVMEGGDWGGRADARDSAPRDPALQLRSYEPVQPGFRDVPTARSPPSPGEVWAGALNRLQTQVSLNTSMLEAHRRQVGDVEQAVGRLQQEMGQVVAVINDMRGEMQVRFTAPEQARHDTEDMQVLASQVAAVTTKANELDGLRMQVELMKNRMKRLEEQGSPAARPGTSMSSAPRDSYEIMHPQQHMQHPSTSHLQQQHPFQQQSHHQGQHHPQHHAQQPQQLPPMRTGSSFASPSEHPQGVQGPHILLSQGPRLYQPQLEARVPYEQQSVQSADMPNDRPAQPLPPPSAISSWRPADSHGLPPPPQPAPYLSQAIKVEPSSSGWATVNSTSGHPVKRPFEEQHQSPYGPLSAPGSPKRPRLAPIMPRTSHAEEPGLASKLQPTSVPTAFEAQHYARSRAASDGSQAQSYTLPTPASANTNAYRFITSNTDAESQAAWRPEAQAAGQIQQEAATSGAKAKGRGKGSRGGRGRGGRAKHQHHDSQEQVAIESRTADWTGSQASPEGYYNAVHSTAGQVPEGLPGGPANAAEHHDFPATPVSGHPHDPFGQHADLLSNSSKKSRSKPTRNADGVLIRKDGRPDMRSVSSAKNLRAVHAKREADKAEADGQTPTSSRSRAPAHSNSMSEEDTKPRSGTPDSGRSEDADDEDREADEHRSLAGRDPSRSVEPEHAGPVYDESAHDEQDTLMRDDYRDERPILVDRQNDSVSHSQPTGTLLREPTQGAEHSAEHALGQSLLVNVEANVCPAQEEAHERRDTDEIAQGRSAEQPVAATES